MDTAVGAAKLKRTPGKRAIVPFLSDYTRSNRLVKDKRKATFPLQ
jgi:hypothetical protein